MLFQLLQGFGLDLSDALAGNAELLADFFQRMGAATLQAEAHAQDLLLARGQKVEELVYVALHQLVDSGFLR